MTLISIVGDVGTGKSLLAVILAKRQKAPIYSNFKIVDERYLPLEPYMLATVEHDACFVIDEAYNWLESRSSVKSINKYISYVLFQSRKSGHEFITTAQLFKSVDVRFREMSDMIVLCERENDNLKDGDFVYTFYKQSNTKPKIRKVKVSYEYAKKNVFPYFDTKEKIPIDLNLVLESITDKSVLLPEVDRICDEMMRSLGLYRYDKPVIRNYCLSNHIASGYVDLIFDRMKARGK